MQHGDSVGTLMINIRFELVCDTIIAVGTLRNTIRMIWAAISPMAPKQNQQRRKSSSL